MLLFKGALVSLLLPLWATIGVVAIGATSFAVSSAEDPTVEDRIIDLGVGSGSTADLETALSVVLVGGIVVHLIAAVATSRAVAAMAGSLGGLLGTTVAGLAAIALAAAPSGERTDGLQVLAQPVAVGIIGAISVVLGFRAYLAHVGRWRYAKPNPGDTWGGGWGDDFGD